MTLRDLPAIVIALAALALGACAAAGRFALDPTAPVLVCNPGPQGARSARTPTSRTCSGPTPRDRATEPRGWGCNAHVGNSSASGSSWAAELRQSDLGALAEAGEVRIGVAIDHVAIEHPRLVRAAGVGRRVGDVQGQARNVGDRPVAIAGLDQRDEARVQRAGGVRLARGVEEGEVGAGARRRLGEVLRAAGPARLTLEQPQLIPRAVLRRDERLQRLVPLAIGLVEVLELGAAAERQRSAPPP